MFLRAGTPKGVREIRRFDHRRGEEPVIRRLSRTLRHIFKIICLDVGRKKRQSVRMTADEAPFLQPVKRRWLPAEMTTAPTLPDIAHAIPIEPYYALLLNPFYRKYPSPSFGKHALTPKLAL